MSKLLSFFTDLSIHPFKRLAFESDPEAAADEAGLGSWEREAVAGSRRELLDADVARVEWQRCAWGADPGPDELPDPDQL